MEDYDPMTFQSTSGDALAAWAVFTVLFAGILVGSMMIGGGALDEHSSTLGVDGIHGAVDVNVPAHMNITACDR